MVTDHPAQGTECETPFFAFQHLRWIAGDRVPPQTCLLLIRPCSAFGLSTGTVQISPCLPSIWPSRVRFRTLFGSQDVKISQFQVGSLERTSSFASVPTLLMVCPNTLSVFDVVRRSTSRCFNGIGNVSPADAYNLKLPFIDLKCCFALFTSFPP